MKYGYFMITIFFMQGCINSTEPYLEHDIKSHQVIQSNINEAKQARSEYDTLQKKRKNES
jgi:hypothetical protein